MAQPSPACLPVAAVRVVAYTLYMVLKSLDKKKVHRSLGAIAGLTSAISVIVGTLAARATPRGWGRVSMALHMTKKPFILKLAPLLTGLSAAIVTAVGIMGFYIWLVERDEAAVAAPPNNAVPGKPASDESPARDGPASET